MGDNFPIVDIKAYNTDRKESQFIQINKKFDKIGGDKKGTEETIKKAKFNFLFDLKSSIAKSATDAEHNGVRNAIRGDKNTVPEQYRPIFEKLSNKWRLTFKDEKTIVPTELRKKLKEILDFDHAGSTEMLAEAQIFLWRNIHKGI